MKNSAQIAFEAMKHYKQTDDTWWPIGTNFVSFLIFVALLLSSEDRNNIPWLIILIFISIIVLYNIYCYMRFNSSEFIYDEISKTSIEKMNEIQNNHLKMEIGKREKLIKLNQEELDYMTSLLTENKTTPQ